MLRPPKLVAIDTNVALDFAKGIDDVCDAVATIRARLPQAELLLPPTVVEELAHAAEGSANSNVRVLALRILRQHRLMGFRLVSFVPLGFEYIGRIAERLRQCRLLPEEEIHDSMVLAESAALGCALLTSSDGHLRAVDSERLARELAKFDLTAPVIATPREIVRMFYRRQ